MKRLLVALAVLALAATAFAYPGPDSIGIYPADNDPGFTASDLCITTSAPFESVTMYLCITNPTGGGVSGWECVVETIGTVTAPSWTLTAGLDVDGTDEGFQVGIGETPLALTPNENGAVTLAQFTGFIQATDDVVQFKIKQIPGSLSFDNSPGYGSADDGGVLIPLVNNAGGPDNVVFAINDPACNIVANTTSSFSSIKNLYR